MNAEAEGQKPTWAILRGRIAERKIPFYHLAPVIGLHPSKLSVLLSGRVEVPQEIAAKILRAVEAWPR
jgi:hypothetical protein